jgi:trehalose 6-phosphate phosphatase
VTETARSAYLFGETGLRELCSFVDRATLFAFDLDGTLAPIVADPAGIKITDEIRECLARLGELAATAVITGRCRADALAHLGVMPRFLVGNHGAEGLPGYEEEERGYVRICRVWRSALKTLLPAADDTGIAVEDKGMSLALHYRAARDRRHTLETLKKLVSLLTPLPRVVGGKCVMNLLSAGAPHKGEALLAVMRHLGCGRALYVGDDDTDEDVFRLEHAAVFGVRVGADSRSAARWHLEHQAETGLLMKRILAMLAQ